jgi:enediyne biosynthesis protein E4
MRTSSYPRFLVLPCEIPDWLGLVHQRLALLWRSVASLAVRFVGGVLLMAACGCNPAKPEPSSNHEALKGTDSLGVSSASSESLGTDTGRSSGRVEVSPRLSFTDDGSDLGIDFKYQNGEGAWLVAMIESNGGGVGWIDYDRDGRSDLFFPGGGQLTQEKLPIMVDNGLFRQAPDGRFSNVAGPSGSGPGVCYSFGAAVGDYDGDGLADLFITGYAGQQLLRNSGDGTFEDATAVAGFGHRGWSSSAAWLDLDNDGDLDLYIAHYGVWSPELDKRCYNGQGEIDRCAPADFVGESDELWINRGDGTFADTSEALRAFQYRGVGVVACDFDLDGDTDLYVANDEDPNLLLDNLGNGQLQDIGASSGTSLGSRSIVDGSMGLAVGDFDGNLKPDLLVTNYQNEYCELYLNQGNRYFALGTRSSGLMALGQAVVGWGTAFVDVDHDSDEDLLIIAGHTSRRPVRSSNLQKPYLLENVQGKRLVSIGEASGEFFREVHAGRGMAMGDLEGDGDVDFVVSMLEQPVQIVRNDSVGLGGYIAMDLVGTQSNRDAIGAWVEIDLGDAKRVKHRIGGGSYASTHSPTLHFGTGAAERIVQLTVHWPSGKVQSLTGLEANQHLILVESDSAEPLH